MGNPVLSLAPRGSEEQWVSLNNCILRLDNAHQDKQTPSIISGEINLEQAHMMKEQRLKIGMLKPRQSSNDSQHLRALEPITNTVVTSRYITTSVQINHLNRCSRGNNMGCSPVMVSNPSFECSPVIKFNIVSDNLGLDSSSNDHLASEGHSKDPIPNHTPNPKLNPYPIPNVNSNSCPKPISKKFTPCHTPNPNPNSKNPVSYHTPSLRPYPIPNVNSNSNPKPNSMNSTPCHTPNPNLKPNPNPNSKNPISYHTPSLFHPTFDSNALPSCSHPLIPNLDCNPEPNLSWDCNPDPNRTTNSSTSNFSFSFSNLSLHNASNLETVPRFQVLRHPSI